MTVMLTGEAPATVRSSCSTLRPLGRQRPTYRILRHETLRGQVVTKLAGHLGAHAKYEVKGSVWFLEAGKL